MSNSSPSPSRLSSHVRERIRTQRARSLERREHDRAMTDPRIRDEHFHGRARATAAGEGDCPYCR